MGFIGPRPQAGSKGPINPYCPIGCGITVSAGIEPVASTSSSTQAVGSAAVLRPSLGWGAGLGGWAGGLGWDHVIGCG